MRAVSYFPVPTPLQKYFATFHRAELQGGQPVTIPAILGQIWFCAKPIRWVPPGKHRSEQLPRSALIGFTSRCFEVRVEEDATLYGCGFWPLGWAELIGSPASDLADRVLNASEIWPEACACWHRSNGEAGENWGQQLLDFALSLAQRAESSPDAHRIAIIDFWLNSDGLPAELADLLHLSQRQVERVTARTHGGSPRLLAGKWRALRAASSMELAPQGDEASMTRFADQSHLIREFRRFIGDTPKPFTAGESLAKRIVADAWHLDSDHPLALSHRVGGMDGEG